MSSNPTSGDRAEVAIQRSLVPPRAGGPAPDLSRKRPFADVLRTLPSNILKVFLEEEAPSQRASELKVIRDWFVACGVRPATRGELDAEWRRRQGAASASNPAPPAPAGTQGRAQAAKRFGGAK